MRRARSGQTFPLAWCTRVSEWAAKKKGKLSDNMTPWEPSMHVLVVAMLGKQEQTFESPPVQSLGEVGFIKKYMMNDFKDCGAGANGTRVRVEFCW